MSGAIERACVASVVFLLAASGSAAGSSQGDAWTFTRRGTRALLDGDGEMADRLYRRALDLAPGFAPAELGRGHVAMSRGEYTTALDYYVAARRGYARHAQELELVEQERGLDALAGIERLDGERERALRELDELQASGRAEDKPDRVAQLEATARARELQVSQLRAIAEPGTARAAGIPADVEFHLGNALFKLGRLPAAVEAWKASAARNAGFALVHRNLAVAYFELGRLDEARASLVAAVRLGAPVPDELRRRLSDPGAQTTR